MDATVIVIQGAASAPDIAAVTDDKGAFAFEGLRPGKWVLRALGPEGEVGEGSVRVTAGSDAEMTIRVRS